VELEGAASYFLQLLYTLYPVPGHVVETYVDGWTDVEHIVTNGAFTFESYEPGESMSLVRDPTYHGKFSGNLERVEVNLSASVTSLEQFEFYKMDSVDVAFLDDATFHARYKYTEEYVSMPTQLVFFIGFDTSRPPFDDVRVRRAFAMAVDRERLANEVLEGIPDPAAGGFVPPTLPGHSPGIGLPYDPAQARQLMAQAGYPDGQGLITDEIVYTPRRSHLLEYLKSQWIDNLNVEVAIKITDWDNVLSLSTHLNRNVFFAGWDADYPDPDCFLRVGIQRFFPRWRNDQYSQLLEEAQRTLDQSERIRLYQEADKILIEDAVIIPVTYAQQHSLVKPWAKIPTINIKNLHFKDVIIEPH
jgi:oligopeptide transport system substrate-binding protein